MTPHPDHSSAAVTCPGCSRSTIATVTFRNAHGEIVVHCLRCGGAESGVEPRQQPVAGPKPRSKR